MIEIKIIKKIDIFKYPWCNDAYLITVKDGLASLKIEEYGSIDKYKWNFLSSLNLNGKPLMHMQKTPCPTCAGMLATGYGIDPDCIEITNLTNLINEEFVDLNKSIELIQPLLGLLEDGAYIIADIPFYPTNGDGTFFWAVPNQLRRVSALVDLYHDIEAFNMIDSYPTFLYPSQSTACFNEERLSHYRALMKNKNAPRGIAYHLKGFVSLLLDGHHKAAAASLEGVPINCLTILPITVIETKSVNPKVFFSTFKIDEEDIPSNVSFKMKYYGDLKANKEIIPGTIINRQWEDEYLKAASVFPTIEEVALEIIDELGNLTDNYIKSCFYTIDSEKIIKIKALINILQRKKDPRLKEIALKCAKLKNNALELQAIELLEFNQLRTVAFKTLLSIKEDFEIKQYFTEFLADPNEKNQLLIDLVNKYYQ